MLIQPMSSFTPHRRVHAAGHEAHVNKAITRGREASTDHHGLAPGVVFGQGGGQGAGLTHVQI